VRWNKKSFQKEKVSRGLPFAWATMWMFNIKNSILFSLWWFASHKYPSMFLCKKLNLVNLWSIAITFCMIESLSSTSLNSILWGVQCTLNIFVTLLCSLGISAILVFYLLHVTCIWCLIRSESSYVQHDCLN